MSDAGSKTGILYLIPNTLGNTPQNNTIPEYNSEIIRKLDLYFVENVQSAVRYLQWIGDTVPEYEIDFYPLNKNTPIEEISEYLTPLREGRDAGLLSEAGCPVIADPGSVLVRMAHARGIRVVPLVGPSSILLALMASGFDGQQFSFHGYLPIDAGKRKSALQQLEQRSRNERETVIFMEAPHRNDEMVRDVFSVCRPATRFCMATNLTLPDEQVISGKIAELNDSRLPSIHKEPTIFLISAGR